YMTDCVFTVRMALQKILIYFKSIMVVGIMRCKN
ncbi:putative membrane protein, partial [Bacteroides fragilis str. S6L3]